VASITSNSGDRQRPSRRVRWRTSSRVSAAE
jgi:hypothetical protein